VGLINLGAIVPRLLVDGLGFLEGPVALPNGDLLCVDLRYSCVWRIAPGGSASRVATAPGSLNGAALGPDGRLYVCNNGGLDWNCDLTMNVPLGRSTEYRGGAIQAIQLDTGICEDLYTACDGVPLKAPNDLVFDCHGGFYFTDHASALADHREYGSLFYALPDGSSIRRLAFPLNHPNGVALAPSESRLYVGDSLAGNLWYWDILGPGELDHGPHQGGATFLARLPNVRVFDSIAIASSGTIVAATLHPLAGKLAAISPDGATIEWVELPERDPFVTNICFGGPDLRTAYVTSGGLGRVYEIDWPEPGLALNYSDFPPAHPA
jgi:gluconolactonase